MSPKLRFCMFAIAGAAIGLSIGVDIANESYGFAALVALISVWLIVDRTSSSTPDAWLLAIATIGYVVGNRGFAQIQPSALVPLLPAEAVLLVAVPALVIRMVFKHVAGIRRNFLNYAILTWIIVGSIRLPLDLRRYGVLALRDFATVYYAAFFFIAQAFGRVAASSKLLTRAITTAFVCLIPVVIIIQISPDFLIDHFTWRGIPIIYQKSDLIATSLAAGFFWLWTRWEKSGRHFWMGLAAASLLLISIMASPRAAMLAIAVTTALWLVTGRWRIAFAQFSVVAAAAVLSVAAIAFLGRDMKTSVPYSMYEHAISIFDPAGSGTYINGESGNPGDNNQFRLIWWRDVIDETLGTSPVFGLGFGTDLSTQFLADYDLLSDETFAARSPHSMIVTVFGRMGTLGLAVWVAVSAGMAQMAWRLIRRGDPDGRGLASVVCVVWVSACFGVVLEGPMGAVIFWVAVGLASAKALDGSSANDPSPVTRPAGEPSGDWPVAKAGAIDT